MSDPWICALCTFAGNKTLALQCELCGNTKPSDTMKIDANINSDGKTYQNNCDKNNNDSELYSKQEIDMIFHKENNKNTVEIQTETNWHCLICTLENDVEDEYCNACNAPSVILNDLFGKRLCRTCNTINTGDAILCKNCDKQLTEIVDYDDDNARLIMKATATDKKHHNQQYYDDDDDFDSSEDSDNYKNYKNHNKKYNSNHNNNNSNSSGFGAFFNSFGGSFGGMNIFSANNNNNNNVNDNKQAEENEIARVNVKEEYEKAMKTATVCRLKLIRRRQFVENDDGDAHFRRCESQFMRSNQRNMQYHAGMNNMNGQEINKTIQGVEYIINPTLINKFEAKKKSLMDKCSEDESKLNIVLAWHGTARENVEGIVLNNFDLSRLSESSGDDGWYGGGIYFSEFASISRGYGDSLLLCKVILGKVFKMNANQQQTGRGLKSGYDSHLVVGHNNNQYGQEIVIFDVDQILPCYIVKY